MSSYGVTTKEEIGPLRAISWPQFMKKIPPERFPLAKGGSDCSKE